MGANSSIFGAKTPLACTMCWLRMCVTRSLLGCSLSVYKRGPRSCSPRLPPTINTISGGPAVLDQFKGCGCSRFHGLSSSYNYATYFTLSFPFSLLNIAVVDCLTLQRRIFFKNFQCVFFASPANI